MHTRSLMGQPRLPKLALAAALALGLAGACIVPQLVIPSESAQAASISGTVNSYQKVSAVSGTQVTVTGAITGAGNAFAVGDHVVLIQMTGTAPATGSNFGNYDRTTITAISGATITLADVTRSYSPGTEAVQLVRVVHAEGTTTVSGTVTATPWDGATGGIVALSGGTLTLDANVDASGTGFTNDHPPTTEVVASMSSGAGSATGRGFDGAGSSWDPAGPGGGGIGGGGSSATISSARGGGLAGGGDNAPPDAAGRTTAPGTNGGNAVRFLRVQFGGGFGAGGGGGVLGGGGGGGAVSGGGGGGVAGGGGGGVWTQSMSDGHGVGGAGGGGVGSVGNGGDGLPGGPSASPLGSTNEGSGGGGGGSYGGGGGVASNWSGGDDSSGGGGGGGWSGGGTGGTSGESTAGKYSVGGDGNAAVSTAPDVNSYFLNATNPRLMMGGAGGRGSSESGQLAGGSGGGIVIVAFDTLGGAGGIISNGANGLSPADFGGGVHSGSGAGAGGQMRITAQTITNTSAQPLSLSVGGGIGGTPSSNNYHAGVAGGGGGAGGVWLELAGLDAACPATPPSNVTFAMNGGASGASIVNPKNSYLTGRAGNGASGLSCTSEPPDDNPTVSFVKALSGDRAESGDQFVLEVHTGSVTGPVVGTSTTTGSGSTVTTGTGAVTVDPAVAGTTYWLTEKAASGTDLARYSSTIQCVDTAGVMAAGTGGLTADPVDFDPSVGHAVTPLDGASIACTLTNEALASAVTFDKRLVSSEKQADGTYVVDYAIDVKNTGGTTESYTLVDTLRPGAGAIFQSGTWSGPTSGSFSGAGVATTLASSRSIAAGITETYEIRVRYAIDPDLVTGSGATASNECEPDGTNVTGFFGFHNTASFTWDGETTHDDVCPPFDLEHGTDMNKVLVSSTKAADGSYVVIYNIVVRNTGDFTEHYDLVDTLRPGAGAILDTATWTGPTSGTFTGAGVTTTLATARSIGAGVQHTYTVTARYTIDPALITGSGSSASNECKPDNTDYIGAFGFHNTATFTWNSEPTDDDACAPFPFGFTFAKALDGPRWMPGDQFALDVHLGTITGPLLGTSETVGSGASIDPNTGVVTVNPAVSGQTYVLTERGANGASLADYEAKISCVDLNALMHAGQGGVTGTVASPGSAPFDASIGHAITPVAGSDLRCVLTNRSWESGVVFHKDLVSSTKLPNGDYRVIYDIVVTNTGERTETYTLHDTLLPGAGAKLREGTWAGPTSGRFEAAFVKTLLVEDHLIAALQTERYIVTVDYTVDYSAITSASGLSSDCKPDNQHYEDSYGFHNTATFFWNNVTVPDDACAPFTPPKPGLPLTGQTMDVRAALVGLGALQLGAFFVVLALYRRGKVRSAS